MPPLHVSCIIKVDDNKTRMKWNKILVSDIMTLNERLKSDQVWLSWELSGKQAANAHKLNKNDLLKVKRRKI